MVVLQVKRSEKDTFLYETVCSAEVDVVLRDLIAIHNLRQRVLRLAEAASALAAHGPSKPPEQQGLDDSTPLLEDYDVASGATAPRPPPARNEHYCPDPTERRTGNAPPPEIAQVLTRTVDDAQALLSERQVAMKVRRRAHPCRRPPAGRDARTPVLHRCRRRQRRSRRRCKTSREL